MIDWVLSRKGLVFHDGAWIADSSLAEYHAAGLCRIDHVFGRPPGRPGNNHGALAREIMRTVTADPNWRIRKRLDGS